MGRVSLGVGIGKYYILGLLIQDQQNMSYSATSIHLDVYIIAQYSTDILTIN